MSAPAASSEGPARASSTLTSARGSKSESVLAVAPVVRRELTRHVHDPALLEDLCQEVLARLLASADRLDPATMTAYARVVAHNAVRSHQRDERNRRRKLYRAANLEPVIAAGADEDANLAEAEWRAVQSALERLSDADRRMLEGAADPEADAGEGAAPGTLRVRLLRARARARVRYLLELRSLTPPTQRCLPVLDALAAGDRARQRAVGARVHLVDCPMCSSLAEEVVRRRRPLAVLVLLSGTAGLWRFLRQHPAGSVAGATAAAAVGVGIASLAGHPAPPVPPPPPVVAAPAPSTTAPPPPTVAGELRLPAANRVLLPVPADVTAFVGAEVRADGVTVRSVVGDEAFWVGSSDQDQLLVVLVGDGESPATLAPGQRIDFTGLLAANSPDTAAAVGVGETEHAELLQRQGVHLQIRYDALVLR